MTSLFTLTTKTYVYDCWANHKKGEKGKQSEDLKLSKRRWASTQINKFLN